MNTIIWGSWGGHPSGRGQIEEQRKRYYEKYKDAKVICECGQEVKKLNLGSHRKTLKHKDFLRNVLKIE